MIIVLVSKCSLDIGQHVEFRISVLISPSKSLISSHWVTYNCLYDVILLLYIVHAVYVLFSKGLLMSTYIQVITNY